MQSTDPRTGTTVDVGFDETAPAGVDACCRAALATRRALDDAGPRGRGAMLHAMATALEAEGDAVVSAADRESGLGVPRLTGELARTAYQLRFFAEVLEDGAYLEATIDHAGSTPAGPRPDLRRMLVPIGVVANFEASNFPLAFGVPGGDTASALAAGCPVVVKAHPSHPETADRCLRALRAGAEQAGLPADVLQLVHGMEAGTRLVGHPHVRAVSFTGSLRGGQALAKLAAQRPDPIPFYGEYGSVNPVVVTPGAAVERADAIAAGFVGSFTLGTGQFCTKPGLLLVPQGSLSGPLGARLRDAVSSAASGWLLTSSIRDQFEAGLAALTGRGDVSVLAQAAAGATDGFHATPVALTTTVEALTSDGAALLEECFGPATIVVEYASEAELLGLLEQLPGSLTATVHSVPADVELTGKVSDVLAERAGRIVHNGYPTGVAVSWAIHHGGPWPSTSDATQTSVGASSIRRFLRPIAYQDAPEQLLPEALRDDNPWRIPRRVDGRLIVL